jgi:hypothetical protein
MFASRYHAGRYHASRYAAFGVGSGASSGAYHPARYKPRRHHATRYVAIDGEASGGVEPPDGYCHARAGVMLCGVTRCGLVPMDALVRVGGVTRGVRFHPGINIQHTLGQASSCTFQASGYRPIPGQQVIVSDESAGGRLLFGGVITRVQRRIIRRQHVFWDCACTDWTELANSYAKVYLRLDNVAVNVAIRRVLAFTDPALGLRAGSIPASLGRVTQTFEGEDVMTAIAMIAAAANAFMRLTPWKRIDLFQGEALDGNDLVLGDTTPYRHASLEESIDQQNTVVDQEGGGGTLTVLAPFGGTTLDVDECGWYSDSGGVVRVGHVFVTYAGRSAASGAGQLTGCTGISEDLPQGASVFVWETASDPTAIANRAALLGGGLSGVAVFVSRDNRLSRQSAAGHAAQVLAWQGEKADDLSWTTDNRHYWPGKIVTVNLPNTGKLHASDSTDTAPAVVGELRLQAVAINFRGDREASINHALPLPPVRFHRHAQARPGRHASVVDILVQQQG